MTQTINSGNHEGYSITIPVTRVNICLSDDKVSYEFSPNISIDSYELALLMEFFICHIYSGGKVNFKYLEDNDLMRHFKKVN